MAGSELTDRLWQGVECREVGKVRKLLDEGAAVDERAPSGLTPLMLAACQGDVEMVRLLLDRHADPLCVDRLAGASVLHKACQGGSLEIVQLLVEGGAFVNLPAATTGHTPLMDALWYKWPKVVKYLVEQGAGLALSTHYGFTLQQHIAYEESVNFFDKGRFAEAKGYVQLQTERNAALVKAQELMAAVASNNLGEVQRLLAAGTFPDERYPTLNGFNDHHTPLHVASRDGHTAIVAELLKAGADVNAVEPTFGAVPLHKAVYNGHAPITALLVRCDGINLDFQGATNGYTPLHDALWHGFADCAKILIDAGARLDLRGHDGLRPLDLAKSVFGLSSEVLDQLKQTPN